MSTSVYEAFERVLKNRGRVKPIIIDGYGKFLFLNRNGLPKVAANYEKYVPWACKEVQQVP